CDTSCTDGPIITRAFAKRTWCLAPNASHTLQRERRPARHVASPSVPICSPGWLLMPAARHSARIADSHLRLRPAGPAVEAGLCRTGGRVVEGARLESVYTFIAYRGFESPSVRQEISRHCLKMPRNPQKTRLCGFFYARRCPRLPPCSPPHLLVILLVNLLAAAVRPFFTSKWGVATHGRTGQTVGHPDT